MDPNSLKGLYIHIPFCSVKCYYCDFVAFSGQGNSTTRYLKALQKEMGSYKGAFVDTLYIGGGTPTELNAEELKFLLDSVQNHFGSIRDFQESTLEANPESLSRDKVDLLKSYDMNRISLGLQATQDRLLRILGRQHTYDDFILVYGNLRRLGFKNLNVDLMFGLPEQFLADFRQSLEQVCDLGPEHVSLYGLQVEEKTVFKKRGYRVEEEESREMYQEALERLTQAGYRHYEISNFAKPGYESVHNQIYWRDEEYVGLGCGATSYRGGVRKTNTGRLNLYLNRMEEGISPAEEEERLEGKEKLGETILLGLRMLSGLRLSERMKAEFHEQWQDLQGKGLIFFEDSKVRLSSEGLFLANRVFREFVPPF
ncbi:MAG: radical SAM family heme chaperone HemW [Elusimicrobia bacterium]|nr:radical SAM family heme chaperone HemW [Elusimicrobiota bacterium]